MVFADSLRFISAGWNKLLKDHKHGKAPGVVTQLDAYQKAEAKGDLFEQVAALHELLDEVQPAELKDCKDHERVEYLDGILKDPKKEITTLDVTASHAG